MNAKLHVLRVKPAIHPLLHPQSPMPVSHLPTTLLGTRMGWAINIPCERFYRVVEARNSLEFLFSQKECGNFFQTCISCVNCFKKRCLPRTPTGFYRYSSKHGTMKRATAYFEHQYLVFAHSLFSVLEFTLVQHTTQRLVELSLAAVGGMYPRKVYGNLRAVRGRLSSEGELGAGHAF